jgi:hypothetical protein
MLVLVLALLPLTAVARAPLVVAPSRMMPGSSVGVLVQGAATVGYNGGGLRVRLVTTVTDKSAAAAVIAASVDAPAPFIADDAVVVQLPVPAETAPGAYTLQLMKLAPTEAGDGTNAVAMANHSITVTAPEAAGSDVLIIETDKPVYKPGRGLRSSTSQLNLSRF